MFKIGDKVRVINNDNFTSVLVGNIGKVKQVNTENSYNYCNVAFEGKGSQYVFYFNQLELLNNMNIKEKFAIALLSEPKKSARKIGILDGDNLLTDEGSKIFLSWLYGKNAEEFKTEVVDGLLKDKKEEEDTK